MIETDDRLLLAQLQDSRLKYNNEVLNREANDNEERKIKKQYTCKNGRVYKVTESGLK